ncbi:RAP-like protein [Trichosporon asahii var. asahii CBS 2479]|uniref:RAP-like protein n=1 Tax=Trichosporon asahii var. asahii (strain ATCC 90039 / CBS 2479 / JCM 2466 / KCTC 7840 / NBRC 103889/ NCYC 2677 / UAMH 7654) TaxID=1186058 RepID=J6EWD0_TRIAS|nr:RAP-like protein [Trichosporon asahii var. asahii CBS 2479]EJT47112.1 RAP-like protein [Trichosporon asahii var. asahii CBS 2479]
MTRRASTCTLASWLSVTSALRRFVVSPGRHRPPSTDETGERQASPRSIEEKLMTDRKQFMVDGQAVILEVLDTAGIDQYLALHDLFMRESDGFILVFSLMSKESFDDVVRTRDQILRLKQEDLVPMVIVGNKCDLTADRVLPPQLGEQLAARAGGVYLETSARNNVNVMRVFHEVVRQMRLHPTRDMKEREARRKKEKKCVIL